MANRFQQVLRTIGKAAEAKQLTEAEVEKLFQERGFFVELGYQGIGKDILAQRGRARKRYDMGLLGFGGRVRAVIEFKQAAAGSLESFRRELLEKYVLPHLAASGVLTNGVDFVLYARTNGDFVEQRSCTFKLSEATEAQARDVEDWLKKKVVNLDSLDSVLDVLKLNRQQALLISAPDSEPAQIFFQVFQLRPESAFGRVVQSLKNLLPRTIESSRFTRGSYEFWQKTFARDLKFKDVPASWRPFLGSKASTEIAQFSFALETAYTIISRLMLAKAADDRRFPGVRFVPRIQESFSELSTRGKLTAENHLEVIKRTFERAGQTLFHSIFSQDIFDWWHECPVADGRPLFHALSEAMLVTTQFDFADLSGDLLGELYQHYFDRDTRKALGEFYTPVEAIEFILDECGYRGQREDRLLDPSCGSGSFLAAALRRYLKRQTGTGAKKVLLDLTEGLRIVGFDINPFAVLMAQVNYAALILPLYAEAIFSEPDFRIVRLPVFRTDSLRIEEREEEAGRRQKETLQVNLSFEEGILNITIYLPIKGEKKGFVKMPVKVPRYQDARQLNLVSNLEDYIAALSRVFQAVRDRRHTLETLLQTRFAERAEKLHAYLVPTLNALEATVVELKGKYDDGRFLKTIEDLVLAVSLKHDLQYDFVVGNPPYVRIQKIPEHVKEYWEGKYEWTEHNYDLYIPFLERAVRSADREGWLGEGGRLGFILSDRFLNVDYGAKLREHMPESLRLDLLCDFRDTRVFAGALNYPAILVGRRHGKGREGEFHAVRVFTSDIQFGELLTEFNTLRRKVDSEKTERGAAVEVFSYPRASLTGDGWWLMPADERRVFERLRSVPGKPLIELTASASGGFAGYQTSADKHLVFDEVEDLGQVLKLRPRHEKESCGCGEKPMEIEKDALRPFLFGKDVGRWVIDWKRTWVLFPYDRYARKETLHGESIENWNLIPCRENLENFEFTDPQKIQIIEERFPNAWNYLCNHESKLRAREDHRYDENKPDAHIWYGAARPQNLSHFFRPKLVLQLLSRRNSFAFDEAGRFVFQAGGKGGGVYGIAPGAQVGNLRALQAFLNSRVADFIVKETSSVYGGRFYSYADQFLKGLPIRETLLESKAKDTRQLGSLAERVSLASEGWLGLRSKLASFPGSFAGDLARYELDTVEHLSTGHPSSAQLTIEPDAISIEPGLYGFSVQYGSQRPFDFEHREHAEALAAALRNRHRKTLPLDEVLNWRLPVKPEGCKKLLSLLSQSRQRLRKLEDQIASEEDALNDLVYSLYGIQPREQKVIEDFLGRYSSHAVVQASEEEQTDPNESPEDE